MILLMKIKKLIIINLKSSFLKYAKKNIILNFKKLFKLIKYFFKFIYFIFIIAFKIN